MTLHNGRSGAPRVLVIGLDSADADLIEQWCEEGYLPTLTALRSQGIWARLHTTAEVMHVSAWPSLYTGARPGLHGMYHAYQIRAGEQAVHRTQAAACALPPFWKYLDDAGQRCIVMDAFMDYPMDGFGGIQILEYGTWTWFSNPGTRPRPLWKEIVRRFGPYPAPEHTKVLDVPEPRHFRDQLIAGARLKSKVVRWLLREEPCAMAFVTFGEPHGAGHYLWHHGDRLHPAHREEDCIGLGNPLRDVYVGVDRAIGEILSELPDSTTVVVTSGDGMGPNYSGCQLMPHVLNRLGLFASASVGAKPGADDADSSGKRPKKGLLSAIREAIPLPLRQAVTRCLPHSLHYRLSMKWANANIDWSSSRAFCIPNANEAYVRVNLIGREPRGIVEPGNEYDDLIGELGAASRQLVNPLNGEPAVHEVFLLDEVFPGPQRENLPDLSVTWDPRARVTTSLASERCGTVRGRAGFETAPYYTGNHRPSAFAVVRGPGVQAGDVLADGSILDLAPTILALLGVEAPPHFEGRVWEEVLTS